MFDETGSDYQPLPARRAPPANNAPPPAPSSNVPLPQGLSLPKRPFWLRLTTYFLVFLLTLRLCGIGGGNALTVIVQIANVGVLGIIVLGLMAMRRWAAWLFIAYCIWTILSGVVVAAARMTHIGEVIPAVSDRDWIILFQLRDIVLSLLLYGSLGIWYAINLKQFIALPFSSRLGNIPFVVMVGILLLFTATQIAGARQYIEQQGEIVEDSRELRQQLFGR